ncbi:unnamed protein product, partial [Ectocarpus sp. 8 AP-2014]
WPRTPGPENENESGKCGRYMPAERIFHTTTVPKPPREQHRRSIPSTARKDAESGRLFECFASHKMVAQGCQGAETAVFLCTQTMTARTTFCSCVVAGNNAQGIWN